MLCRYTYIYGDYIYLRCLHAFGCTCGCSCIYTLEWIRLHKYMRANFGSKYRQPRTNTTKLYYEILENMESRYAKHASPMEMDDLTKPSTFAVTAVYWKREGTLPDQPLTSGESVVKKQARWNASQTLRGLKARIHLHDLDKEGKQMYDCT